MLVQNELRAVDYVGVSQTTGKHIMGIAQVNLLQTEVTIDPHLQWTVPSDWSMEDAATVPLYYSVVSTTVCHQNMLRIFY